MKHKDKTKEKLINESAKPHERIEDLKARKAKHNRAEFVSNVCLLDHRRSIFIRDNAK